MSTANAHNPTFYPFHKKHERRTFNNSSEFTKRYTESQNIPLRTILKDRIPLKTLSHTNPQRKKKVHTQRHNMPTYITVTAV